MEKVKKLLAIFLTVLLLCGIVGVTAFANDGEEDVSVASDATDHAYSVFNPETGITNYYDNDNDLKDAFINAGYGGIVTLLRDVVHTSRDANIGSATADKERDVYLDLNGHQLLHAYSTTYTFIEPADYVNLYVCSSVEGGSIHSVQPDGSYTLFSVRYNGASVTIGEVRLPIYEQNEGKYEVTGYKTCSGKNLTTYSAHLVTTYRGVAELDKIGKDVKINITGGTHYQTAVGRSAPGLIILENDVTISVSNSTFVAYGGSSTIITMRDSYILTPGQSVSFKDCYFSAAVFTDEMSSKVNLTFENCYFDTNKAPSATSTENVTYANCYFTLNSIPDYMGEPLRTYEYVAIGISKATYEYVTPDGETIYADVSYSSDTVEALFTYAVPSEDADYVTVVWNCFNETLSEKWAIGENIIPVPPIATPAATEVLRYDYYPTITSTAQSGDAEYCVVAKTNFTIKANLALYSDFVYNMYIPKSAADSEGFNWARIDAVDRDGSVSTLTEVDFSKLKVFSIKITETVSEDYYVIPTSIDSVDGDTTFRLVINVDVYNGETVTHTQEFSIFDYADRVESGNYSDEAKAMVAAVKTYIKAARNFFSGETEDAKLPYPVETNSDLLPEKLTAATRTAKKEMSTEMKAVIHAATLSLEARTKFAFYICMNAPLEDTDTVTFGYRVYTQPTTIAVTFADIKEKCPTAEYNGVNYYYFELDLHAVDLRSPITIDVSTVGDGVDYTYRLANYAYSVDGISDTLDTLMDALWTYSLSTFDYLATTESDSPTVDITIAGNEVTADTYAIVADGYSADAAEALMLAIYKKTGEMLDIAYTEVSGKNSIYVTVTDPTPYHDFKAYVQGSDLILTSGYRSFIDGAIDLFTEEYLSALSASSNFAADFTDTYYTDRIYYSDFGAYGVDMTAVAKLGEKYADINNWHTTVLEELQSKGLLVDDFFNIKAAHDMANMTKRHTVYADGDAVYYIKNTLVGSSAATISVQTNTNWCGANFVIDDSERTAASEDVQGLASIFVINAQGSTLTITDKEILSAVLAAGLNPDTKRIDIGLGYPAMIIPTNSSHNVYRRRGYSGYAGEAMHESILIDENGYVTSDSLVVFDYTSLDSIAVYRTDLAPVTVSDATVTTIASRVDISNASCGYIERGISIQRANTTLDTVKHVVIGDFTMYEHSVHGYASAPNHGLFTVYYATNVTISNCTFVGRRYYGVSGTYDFSARNSHGITLTNCTQSNFWVTVDPETYEITEATEDTEGAMLSMATYSEAKTGCKMHWGLGGTNYCKNICYLDSTLSRYDAHAGVYNGRIENCDINFISLTGGGYMNVENVRWFSEGTSSSSNSLIYLRNDYGSTWNGTITVKDVDAYFNSGSASYILYHQYNNWYFGYEAYFPNLVIDNLDFYDLDTREKLTPDSENFSNIQFLTESSSITSEPNMHLEKTSIRSPYFAWTDADKDNYIDEIYDTLGWKVPYSSDTDRNGYVDAGVIALADTDGDGNIDGTTIAYDESYDDGNGFVAGNKIRYRDADGDCYVDGTTLPYYFADKNSDGYIDCYDENGMLYSSNTLLKYPYIQSKANEIRGGFMLDSALRINLNPIVPPEKIIVMNIDEGYESIYTKSFTTYINKSTFFDGTYIALGTRAESGEFVPTHVLCVGKDHSDKTPVIDY